MWTFDRFCVIIKNIEDFASKNGNFSLIYREALMLECFAFMPRLQFGANCYVLKSGNEYCVIDPSASYAAVSEKLGDISSSVKYIILTHSHFDHTLALDEWIEITKIVPSASTNACANVKDADINCYKRFFGIDKSYQGPTNVLREGDALSFGDDLIRVIETPGHTNGSICLIADGMIFSGDTLFSGGAYGRCDLPTGDIRELSASVDRILSLPDYTIIYSGHGDKSTINEAKAYEYIT